jgi:hypothetical protein
MAQLRNTHDAPSGVPVEVRAIMRLLSIGFGLMIACAAMAEEQPRYSVKIDEGLSPRMRAEDVAQLAVTRLARGLERMDVDPTTGEPRLVPATPEVLELRCMTYDKFFKIRDKDTGELERRVVWLVRAKGEFVNHRTPEGQPSSVHDAGYLIFDDSTGRVVAFGSTEPPVRTVPKQDEPGPVEP